MHRRHHAARRSALAIIAIAATILSITASSAVAATPATPPGVTVGTLEGLFLPLGVTNNQFDRKLCAKPNKCQYVSYRNYGGQASIADGVAKLDKWVRTTPGKKIVHGYSLGASVASAWLRKYNTDPTAPSPADLSFVLTGNPEYAVTGSMLKEPGYGGIPAASRYAVTDYCRKWDSVCYDAPRIGWTSPSFFIHLDYTRVKLVDPAHQVTVAGNVTSVLVPTAGRP